MREKDLIYLALGAGALYIGYNYLKSQEGKAPIETNINLPNISIPNISLPNISLPNITIPGFNLPNLTTPTIGGITGEAVGIMGQGFSNIDGIIKQISTLPGTIAGAILGTALRTGEATPAPIIIAPSQATPTPGLGMAVNNVTIQEPIISEPQAGKIIVPASVVSVLSGGQTVSIPTSSVTGGSGNIVQIGGNQWGGGGTLYQKAGNFGVIKG